jgi:FtsP/CotA-like multicopper oxidase with cupredoxin domain
MFAVLAILGLTACQAPVEIDTGDVPAPTPAAMPEIWGPPTAVDHNPDPWVVEVHLKAGTSEMNWVDAGPTQVWSYNDSVPGPLIQVPFGAKLEVLFENALPDDETTIHWHGLRIDDAMDGVPAIQDPVEPGESFLYEFTPPDSGSYWYHPHVRSHEQIERGLHGALVVHEEEPVEVDKERYFVLDDVSLRNSGAFTHFEFSAPNSVHGRHGNVLLVNGSSEPLEDEVRPGGTERWRIVNTANARTMWVGVEGASWRVIALDGNLLAEPYETDAARLPVGRRIDLEVIPDGESDEVKLNILLPDSSTTFTSYQMFSGTQAGEPGPGEWKTWPAAVLPTIEEPQQSLDFELNGVGNAEGGVDWSINGDLFADGVTYEVDRDLPSVLRLKKISMFEHPFHLHGQFFQVLSRNGDDSGEPGFLDTVLIEGMDEVEIFTGFENPGKWMMHCHILEHAEQGMMTMIEVK